jgi:hypothetical protein
MGKQSRHKKVVDKEAKKAAKLEQQHAREQHAGKARGMCTNKKMRLTNLKNLSCEVTFAFSSL